MTELRKGMINAFKEMRLVLIDEYKKDMLDTLQEQREDLEISSLNYSIAKANLNIFCECLKEYMDNELAMRELIYEREDKLEKADQQ